MSRKSLLVGAAALIVTSFVLPLSQASAGEIDEILIWLGWSNRDHRHGSTASVGETVISPDSGGDGSLESYMSSESEGTYSPVYDEGGSSEGSGGGEENGDGGCTSIPITPIGDEFDDGGEGGETAPVPEPFTLLLFSAGGGAALLARRRRQKA